MTSFRFFIPIQVRYGDIDAQAHVNHTRFLTYLEQARFSYLLELGLWDGQSFLDVGLIVADVHAAYLAPIRLTQKVVVRTRVAKIGNKSITFEYRIEDAETGALLSTAETVMVSYDYHAEASRPVPEDWRAKINAYEAG